ncbi:DUF4974 domain-containing protein [uncultured Duncaniella sp.]|uniref:DUF4974 domain-containing protein n=1 Tax=uncultured Duncaniella sp. TaxID=2768039 RepID=UPI0025A9E100|nr:DUF4974 domain-containing protein [uncultured Duncaniella sp.]
MDKYELVLDMVEHPEKYTSGQLAEIMSDPEVREIYNLLCKADSSIEANKEVDVDAEWEDFSEKHAVRPRRSLFGLGSRAASIAAIVGTSIVAVAAGIAVSVAVIGHKPEPVVENVVVDPLAVVVSTDTLTTKNDTVMVNLTPIMFEDEPLEKIMKEVADAYGVEVRFNDKEAASLHLYYKFDPSLPLNEVVEQLNTFEQINIKQNDNVLTID